MKKRILSVILSAMIISATMLSGCGCENKNKPVDEVSATVTETHEVSEASSVAETEPATLNTTDKAISDAGLKVDDKGNITDKNGNKVETKNGKVEVKTEDGKTVTVNVTDVSTVQTTNSKANTSTSSKTNTTSSKANSSKPTSSKPSSSSSSSSSSKPVNQSSASKQESSKVEETKHTHTWVDITKQVKVIDKEAYSYEEDVYEYKVRTICNDCGADITGNTDHIFDEIANNPNAKGSYRAEKIKTKTGTNTINVPEQSHYETKTIGRKCTSCGKTENS